MKISSKNKSSQKGLSPILIIVGIVLVGVVAFALFASKSSQKATTTQNTEQGTNYANSVSLNDFNKVDDSAYTLYYPKGYVCLSCIFCSSHTLDGSRMKVSKHFFSLLK